MKEDKQRVKFYSIIAYLDHDADEQVGKNEVAHENERNGKES